MTDDPHKAYRASLVVLMEKMQAEYDKAVLLLSGGAIGLSITFSKDLIGKENLQAKDWLFTALLCWCVSLALILASFFTSGRAMERAIRQTDQRTLYTQPAGGFFDKLTRHLNIIAGVAFLFGLLAISIFVRQNLK